MHITNGDRIQALILKAKVYSDEFFKWFGNWEKAAKENPYSKDISIGSPEADFSNVDSTGTGVLIPIFLNGEYIGETGLDNALYHKDKGMSIKGKYMEMPSVGGSNITIEKEYRGKGYGKATYFELAKLAANNGKILRSAPDKSRTPASTRVWESLVRDGYAKRVNDRYEIINSTLNNASKVVDENGEPLVVYHGTQDSFTTVDFSKSDAGQGFYAASGKDTAETYGLNNKYALFFNLKNPYIIEGFGQPWNKLLLNDEDYTEEELKQPYKLKRLSTRDIENFAKNKGYDGVIFKDIIDQGKYSGMIHSKEESYIQELLENSGEDYTYANSKVLDFLDTLRTDVFVVFDSPNQVKSATDNVGTFSRTDDDIRYREVPNSSFESLDTEMQENLLKKGWTAEKFDSISQEERDQAIKCIAF